MAKFSAQGDRAEYRWANASGRALVLTQQGRLLGKHHRRDRYRLLARNVSFEQAERSLPGGRPDRLAVLVAAAQATPVSPTAGHRRCRSGTT